MKFLTPIFRGTIEFGKIVFHKKEMFDEYMKSLEGKEVEITVRKPHRKRSDNQNKYYWAVVVAMVAHEMGVYPEDAHEFLKGMFLKKGVEVRGKRYTIKGSTTNLSTQSFEDYMNSCRMWSGTELKINIPLPREVELK